MTDYHEAGGDDEFDYYIVHDSVGVSHIIKTRKGAHPGIRCVGCDG